MNITALFDNKTTTINSLASSNSPPGVAEGVFYPVRHTIFAFELFYQELIEKLLYSSFVCRLLNPLHKIKMMLYVVNGDQMTCNSFLKISELSASFV